MKNEKKNWKVEELEPITHHDEDDADIDNVRCVFCGSEDAFVFLDFSLDGEKKGSCRSCKASWDA